MTSSIRSQYLMLIPALILALVLQAVALPPLLSAMRPSWVALILGYWAYRSSGVGLLLPSAAAGLCLDVMFNTALGTHVVALTVVVYATLKLRGYLYLSPLWQTTLILAPIWLLYSFILFWADGATLHAASPLARWLPVISTTLLWPMMFLILQLLRPITQPR